MSDPLLQISVNQTPQTSPIPGSNQEANNGGGYSFVVDSWTQLERFLILGTWGGTYYVTEQKLTKENSDNVIKLVQSDGVRVVDAVYDVSMEGRAYKQNPTLFTLAAVVAFGNAEARSYALSKVSSICRTGTMLYQFVNYCENLGSGWGRAMKRTIGEWYTDRTPNNLANQLVKYRQRDGWSHKDLLRLSKPKISNEDPIYPNIRWAVGKEVDATHLDGLIQGYLLAQAATNANTWVALINQYQLPWEALPTQALNETAVWEALVPHMGLTALMRNLGKMGTTGMINHSQLAKLVNARINTTVDEYKKARVHPMQILLALSTYSAGRGVKGSNSWTPVGSVVDNLNEAFYKSFGVLEPTGKRRLLALDVSGSMEGATILNTHLTARDASAALALVALNQDVESYTMAFSGGFIPLNLSPKTQLKDAIATVSRLPFDWTDCSVPIQWAMKNQINVDTFEIYTDSETNAGGSSHAAQVLQQYRKLSGIPAKMVVNGMTASRFTIADPNDAGMLDVVGMDANTPKVITDFIAS